MDSLPRFGHTTIHPLGIAITLLAGTYMLFCKHRYVIIPMLIVTLYITSQQRIVIGGLDFDMVRIIIIFGMLREIRRRSFTRLKFNRTDRIFLIWIIFRSIAHSIMRGDSAGMIYSLGNAFTTVGLFLLFRINIQDLDDVRYVIVALAVVSVPIALLMINEQVTGRNLFSIFGRVPVYTISRMGHLRSQAAFPHAILAGSYGASVLPLMWGLWFRRGKSRVLALIGAVAATIITFTSASSGPIMSYMAGFIGMFLWLFRKKAKVVVVVTLLCVMALSLYMEAPIYALIGRVSVVGGSTGYHRVRLIDQAIKRIDEWWLVGVKSTDHWGFQLFDVTNRYIREGVDGGIFSLLLFIGVIISSVNTVIRFAISETFTKEERILVWGIIASFFTHKVSFLSVSYFGQMAFFWYLPVAMISSIRDQLFQSEIQRDRDETQESRPHKLK